MLIMTLLTIISFNIFVLPIATEICSKYATTEINREINKSADNVIKKMKVKTSDFTEEITNTDTDHININSLLINSVTNQITEEISYNLNELSNKKINIPIGLFSGVPLFSRLGFNVPIHIVSIGDAKADYDTILTSAGVNQVSYQIWLNIECNVTIVSPLLGKNICVKRKLMLVNTIFNGKVPQGYADIKLK